MKNKISIFLSKTLILIIIFLITVITIKKDDKNKLWIKDKLLSKNISFSYINSIYNKYLGGIMPFSEYKDVMVFNEKLEYKNIEVYKDGICLDVSYNYLVPVQYSGVVIFVGDKGEYKNTVIIENENVTMWYSNIDISSIKIYDYFEKGKYLGQTLDDKLYLLFEKDGEMLNYKDYI